MKRFAAILVAQFVVIAAAAFVGSWAYAHWHTTAAKPAGDEMSWFRTELGLNAEQAAKLDSVHEQFLAEQSKLCEEHCAKRVELGELIKQSESVTPRIEQLTRELSEIEARSQRVTIEHIFAVSKQLNASQRESFVSKVYEQMCSSCPMGAHKPAVGKQAACGSTVCECCVASNSEAPEPVPPVASLPTSQPRLDVTGFTSSVALPKSERSASREAKLSDLVLPAGVPKFVVFSVFRI